MNEKLKNLIAEIDKADLTPNESAIVAHHLGLLKWVEQTNQQQDMIHIPPQHKWWEDRGIDEIRSLIIGELSQSLLEQIKEDLKGINQTEWKLVSSDNMRPHIEWITIEDTRWLKEDRGWVDCSPEETEILNKYYSEMNS